MRDYQTQLESDYQDTCGDYVQVSEMVLRAKGDERQALLVLRNILKGTIKVMEKEMENF